MMVQLVQPPTSNLQPPTSPCSILQAFGQNVLADETSFTLVLKKDDLSGCPADLVAAARQVWTGVGSYWNMCAVALPICPTQV